MDVSERIKELRDVLTNCTINTDGRTAMTYKINCLAAGIIETVQTAAANGYDAGYKKGYKEALRLCNIEKRG